MPDTPQDQSRQARGAEPERTPGSTTKPGETQTPGGPPLDSTAEDIAGLTDDFSRLHSRDPAQVEDMPQPEGHHKHGDRSSPASAVGAMSDHVKREAELSTDEWQSSDDEEPGDTLSSDRGSDIIDRIMRSFCVSLDSKIAAIKESPAIKTEQEPAPKAKVVRSRKETAPNVQETWLKRRSKTAPTGIRAPLGASPRASIASAPSIVAPPSVQAVAAPGAPAKPLAQIVPASAPPPPPPPPPLPPAPATFKDRLSRFLSPPPPPPPQLPERISRDRDRERRLRDRPSPLPARSTSSIAEVRTLGDDTSSLRERFSSNESSGAPVLRRRAQTGSVRLSSSVQPLASSGPGGAGDSAAADELRDASAGASRHSQEDVPPTGRWYSRFSKKKSGRHAGELLSATISTPSAEIDEEEDGEEEEDDGEDEGIGSAVLLGQSVLDRPVLAGFDGVPDRNAFVPPPTLLGLHSGGGSLIESSSPPADLAAAPDFFGSLQPQTFGDFQSYYSSDLDGRPPDHQEYIPALAAPEPLASKAPRPGPKKRVTDEELQEGTVHHVQPEADGDGRRKKAKRGSVHTPPDRGAKKFACPYFKRNPKKYRKWTSCPGPGWDEVHRVKTHLYRRHPLPIQCPRCWAVFKADGQLQSHLQQDPPCAMQANQTLQEGFTKDQEKKLRSRKKTHADMTDEDKWREIYRVLFPDDDLTAIPSPYYSEADGGSGSGSLNSGELEDYATFIRREMPTLVRRELETLFRDEFQDVEERLRPRIAEIVLNLQPRLLGLYKQSQTPLSEYGPQHGDTASGSEPTLTPLMSQGTGTESLSTPSTAPGTEGLGFGTEPHLAFTNTGLDATWDAHYPEGPQVPETDVGLGLDWDFEFDKLLNPMLFLPPVGEAQHETLQVPPTQQV